MVIGTLFAVAVLCGFFALQRLPGSTYVVLFFTYPAMIVLLSTLLGEAISPRAWLALALALIGVGLTVPDFVVPNAVDPVGAILALANAAIVAAYYLMARRVLAGVEDISRASAHMMGATLLILLLSLPARGLQMPQNPATLVGLFLHCDIGNGAAGIRYQHRNSAHRTGQGFSCQHHRTGVGDDRGHDLAR